METIAQHLNKIQKQQNMKTLIIILFTFISLAGYTQDCSIIKGKVKSDKLKTVTLYQTVNGDIQKYAETQVGKDGSYGFLLTPEQPGFYSVGDERMNFIFYLQGGEEVNIDLLENKAELTGKNTKENIALYKWEDYAANIRLKSVFFERTMSNYEDFFPEFETFLAGKDKLKKELKTGNQEFDTMLQQLMDYKTDYYAIMFLFTPRDKHPEPSMYPEYYKHIVSNNKFLDDMVLKFPEGVKMINCYCNYAQSQNSTKNFDYTDVSLAHLHTDKLKGVFVVNNEFLRYKSYDQYLSGMEKYGKYLVTPSLKEMAEAVGTKLYNTRPGGVAADFTYPDVNGKMVSLSDFKGKVVLVDVWATWCGPCRGEIPHLKKLEEEMHGKDVVFLGVSVDEAKNKQKWLDFIEKEGLKGVQVLASGWSKITKDYKITGIPRFMVFDRNGNIVSIDAPRPSNPALKEMLEAELAK